MIKNNKGLTLVNLIATLVLMLIITYITVSLVVGDEGVINEADNIKNQSEIEDIKEKIYLSVIKNTAENGDIDIDAIKSEVENGDIKNISLDGSKIKFEYNGMGYEVDVNDVSDTVKAGYNNSSTPNAPYLMSGMEPIKWIKGQDGKDVEVPTNENDKEWYNYDKQLWANAKTVEDESYWVWIPRYEYKITYYTDDTKTELSPNNEKTLYGKIDINFIPKEKTIPTDGYKIHPAFTDGTDNYFDNGEWDKEVSGIWVSKYVIGCETSTDGINWSPSTTFSSSNSGNKLTTNAGGEGFTRAVSKSEEKQTEWNWITIGGAYSNSYYYDREKESHLIKNSEYGAVAYLSYSKYGANQKNIIGESVTKNITGIFLNYDVLYTSSYLADGKAFSDEEYIELGNFYLKDLYNEEKDTKSTKYVTRYPYDPTTNNNYIDLKYGIGFKNFEYIQEKYRERRYGDAIIETSMCIERNGGYYAIQTFEKCYVDYLYGYKDLKLIVRDSYGIFSYSSMKGNSGVVFNYMIVLSGE